MMRSRHSLFTAVTAGLLLTAVPAAPAFGAGPELSARAPAAPPANPEKRNGVLSLAGGTYAYLPKGLTGAPAPVLVVLHGAGGQAADMLEQYRDEADKHGIILLIPNAAKGTWDMINDLKGRLGAEFNVTPRYGKDLKAIDAGLADLFNRVAVDPARVGVLGFSDGATYGLSIGTANPQLFRTVIAFSPGPAFLGKIDPTQRVFISHSENDKVLPYSTARGHVAKLRVKKAIVAFESHDAGHKVPDDVNDKAFAFFVQR